MFFEVLLFNDTAAKHLHETHVVHQHFHDGGPYHIQTSPLVCRANQWTGFNMIWTSVMKELKTMSFNESVSTYLRKHMIK